MNQNQNQNQNQNLTGCEDIFNIVYTSTPSTTVENNVTTAVNKLKNILMSITNKCFYYHNKY